MSPSERSDGPRHAGEPAEAAERHTPGQYFLARHIPWTHCGCEPRVSLNEGTYGMTSIAYCSLHAAAPELLEALEQIVHDRLDPGDMWKIARAALAKATGESQ